MPLTHVRLIRSVATVRSVPNPQPAPNPPEGPAAPTDMAAVAIGPTQVNTSWVSNSGPDTTFHVRRGLGVGPGDTIPIGDVPNNGTTFSDFTVQPNTQYFYTVWASNPSGASDIAVSNSVTTPSEGATLFANFYSPVTSVIEGSANDLRARVLNPDETIHTEYNPADWDFSIIIGGSLANIGGPNNDVLTVNPGTFPDTLRLRATYTGTESLNPDFDDIDLNITSSTPVDWPEDLEPPGMTQVIAMDGSTLSLPDNIGWLSGTGWSAHSRFGLEADPNSKFGSTMEKRAFIGDPNGWGGVLAITLGSVMNFREIYVRIVFMRSLNFQNDPGGDKFLYIGKKFPGFEPRSFTLGSRGTRIKFHNDSDGNDTTSGTGNGGDWLSENTPSWPNGSYNTLQYLVRFNTNGNADGLMRCKVNNTEVLTWTRTGPSPDITGASADAVMWKNSNFFSVNPNQFFNGWQMFYFWGGSSGPKSVNDFHRISEIYVSGRNP